MTFHLFWSKSQPSQPDLQGHTTPGPCLADPYSLLQPLGSSSRRPCTKTWQVRGCLTSTIINGVTSTLRGPGLHDELDGHAGLSLAILLSLLCLAPSLPGEPLPSGTMPFTQHTPGVLCTLTPGPPPPLPSSWVCFSSLDFSSPQLFFSFVYCVSLPAPLCRLCEGKVLFFFPFFSFYFIFLPHYVACGILVTHSGIEPVAPCIGSPES